MTDVFSPEKRSWVMSRIRGKHTKPELTVRSLLHRLGYRFTVNGPRNKKLPGKPDIVLPKHRTVVFVHGCFWHAHPGCRGYRIPKSRTVWWEKKLTGNAARDVLRQAELRQAGWNVVVVWECETKAKQLPDLAARIPGLIEPPPKTPRKKPRRKKIIRYPDISAPAAKTSRVAESDSDEDS